jgi:hypothetical protein
LFPILRVAWKWCRFFDRKFRVFQMFKPPPRYKRDIIYGKLPPFNDLGKWKKCFSLKNVIYFPKISVFQNRSKMRYILEGWGIYTTCNVEKINYFENYFQLNYVNNVGAMDHRNFSNPMFLYFPPILCLILSNFAKETIFFLSYRWFLIKYFSSELSLCKKLQSLLSFKKL